VSVFFKHLRALLKMPFLVNNMSNVIKLEAKKVQLDLADFNEYKRFADIRDKSVIVSFTTYGEQIHEVHYIIKSILSQTIRPNKIVLWLDESEFSESDIPLTLSSLYEFGLEVEFVSNIKSYKKYIPTAKKYPNDIIITIDDDFIYPQDMVEGLLREHLVLPNVILGTRAHRVKYNKKGKILPYNKWEYEANSFSLKEDVFLTSGAGMLFPPGLLSNEVFNEKVFMELADSADDIWFKVIAHISGVDCKKIDDKRDWPTRYLQLSTGYNQSLSSMNVGKARNDTQLSALLNFYNLNSLRR